MLKIIILDYSILGQHSRESWNEGMIVAVKRNLCNCVKKPEKNSGLQRGLNPWPCDTGAMLYQLSYEATDVGSRSVVGSYVPVKEMSVYDIWNESYMNCGNEIKWNEGMIVAVKRNLCNCEKKLFCQNNFEDN